MKSTENQLYFFHQVLGTYCIVLSFIYGYASSFPSFERGYLEGTVILIFLYGVMAIIFFFLNFLDLLFKKSIRGRKTWKEIGDHMGMIVDFIVRDFLLILGAIVLSIAPHIGYDLMSAIPISLIGITMIVYGLLPPLPPDHKGTTMQY